MKEFKKENNTLYITHSGETLIWLIIVLIAVSIGTFFYVKSAKTDNDYQIFMNDVDGLIVGSPVRMMGIEVGHVTKIQPTNEEIYIKFIINNKEIELPQGTVATVEFSGMAGSKSLELYLPDKNTYIDSTVPMLAVTSPKRLHDAAGLLNEMFDKLSAIMYTSSSFSNKLNLETMDMNHSQNKNVSDLINYADEMVDDGNKKLENLNKQLMQYQKDRGFNNVRKQ